MTHTYAAPGVYLLVLTVRDAGGTTLARVARFLRVAAPNQPPVASFTALPSSGHAPLAVNFNGGRSSDSDGVLIHYTWAFGDGTTATGVTPAHTYAAAGAYIARLDAKRAGIR